LGTSEAQARLDIEAAATGQAAPSGGRTLEDDELRKNERQYTLTFIRFGCVTVNMKEFQRSAGRAGSAVQWQPGGTGYGKDAR